MMTSPLRGRPTRALRGPLRIQCSLSMTCRCWSKIMTGLWIRVVTKMRRKSDAREVTSRCCKPWGKGLMEQHLRLDLCETGRYTSWNRSILVSKGAIWRRPTSVRLWEKSSCYNDYKIIHMLWSTTILSWRKNVYTLSWNMLKRATFMAT